MHQTLKQTAHEARGMLADASIAQLHPSSSERPTPGSAPSKHMMHIMHVALMKSGRLANKSYERKTPSWPVKGESISVLGYGAEKIAYKVSGDQAQDAVVAVYHMESTRKNPLEVIERKKANYQTHQKYFGDIIVPTTFVVLDNPWGDGTKPATIQPFIKDTEKLGSFTEAELRERAGNDSNFAESLDQLVSGYQNMLADGIFPDFSSSNLLIAGSKIVMFDTGQVYPAAIMSRIAGTRPNYQLVESLGATS